MLKILKNKFQKKDLLKKYNHLLINNKNRLIQQLFQKMNKNNQIKPGRVKNQKDI